MNEKFITRNLNKDGVLLCSINNSMKGVKIINKIAIYRDLISLIIEKNTKAMKQDITIYIDDKKIILNTSQTDDYNGIQKKLNMSISIYNDKITSNISTTNENFTKDVNKEIEYTNKIRYMIIMKIMYWLVKICKKKMKLLKIKRKIKIKKMIILIRNIHIRFYGGISTAKISVTI